MAQSSDEGKHEAHSRLAIPSEIDAPSTYHEEEEGQRKTWRGRRKTEKEMERERFYIVRARLFDFAFR
ncbi:hypothetical protein K0M31_016941 [Melipona bicolor]|uniref:Uncharacterized protein n=1 Tax=Melipona bicolor TaxID=60889 RepID=A0AA40KED5_9HYME|nr:hypothetical protein K0M31_016941 [Melipona bicolor]